ncbi:hypothetical protein LV82_01713 [Albidovulum inexpectatum]|uniref:Cytochrome P460 n=1 Tax=Albidovulum inexpectatum TaxID=196587 RepID=A0A2S5JHR4_9RHOB|nr:hypothetical protein [Albidovulum inexpectatum]PPB80980.1 hypothetical protein LV82_01713 [Albidovulum inexpectatum]
MQRLTLAAILGLSLVARPAVAQDMPFGTEQDTAYAQLLWEVMQAERLVGPQMIRARPYEGTDPHGMMLETFYTRATIDGHSGDLIVKRNFGPAGVTEDQVLRDPASHLGAVTVMFRRAAGYDPEDGDWSWVKYLPDGSLDKAPNGTPLAGRVAKGMDTGCIACHRGAGEDMVFTSDYLMAN